MEIAGFVGGTMSRKAQEMIVTKETYTLTLNFDKPRQQALLERLERMATELGMKPEELAMKFLSNSLERLA